jgi:predicted nucleic acid-binding protein
VVVRSGQRDRTGVRKGRITDEKASAFLESLADLPIEIENPTPKQMFVSVRALVGRHNLTAYDASYLELAIRHKLPIAASDNALAKAAQVAGINLVQL